MEDLDAEILKEENKEKRRGVEEAEHEEEDRAT